MSDEPVWITDSDALKTIVLLRGIGAGDQVKLIGRNVEEGHPVPYDELYIKLDAGDWLLVAWAKGPQTNEDPHRRP